MQILFISSVNNPVSFQHLLAGNEDMQFGISYISACLKQKGHQTSLLLLSKKYRSKNERLLRKQIQQLSPSVIAFTAVYSEYDYIVEIARFIRKSFPSVFLVGGGVHISLNPHENMLDVFDAICLGEGEQAMVELVGALETHQPFTSIENLWVRQDKNIFKNGLRVFNESLGVLPFPDRSMWLQWILERNTRLTVLLGRGCPYNCSYCCNHKLRKIAQGAYVRFRPVSNILNEIETLNSEFPQVREYMLEAETLAADMDWLEELCLGLAGLNAKRSVKLLFSANLRIFPTMDQEKIWGLLAKAGFTSVSIGLESGSEKIRREVLNRNYSNEHIFEAAAWASKYGIKLGLFNLIGVPGETYSDFCETLAVNRKIQPHWHATSIFFPYPGTELYECAQKLGLLNNVKEVENERQQAVLDLPDFTRKQIQQAFDSFHYEVYRFNSNANQLKKGIYFLMKYVGHNRFAKLKRNLLCLFYFFHLQAFARKFRLVGIFQKD